MGNTAIEMFSFLIFWIKFYFVKNSENLFKDLLLNVELVFTDVKFFKTFSLLK